MTLQTDLLVDTAALFVQASRLLDPVRLQFYEGLGLTLPQVKIMMQVEAQPGLSGRALAATLGITASAVSQHVDRLVRRGLMQRTEDPDDRRRLSLELTASGHQALADLMRAVHDLAAEELKTLASADLGSLHQGLAALMATRG